MLQTKFQETYYTILKYKNVIIFAPSFVFIALFLRPCCSRKEAWNFEDFKRENAIICQFRTFLNFGRKINRWNFKLFSLE